MVAALRLAVGGAVVLGLLSGCAALMKPLTDVPTGEPESEPVVAEPVKPLPPPDPPKKTKLFEWTGDGRAVTRIVVNVDDQKARFFEDDKEVGWTYVASGVSRHPTPIGIFSVKEKVANKESNLYGKVYGKGGQLITRNAKMGTTPIPPGARFDGADMPYFLRLTNDGIGLHAGPIPKPGRAASHGCIRMPKDFAPILFRHVDIGTEVSIVGKGPSYATYLAQQRKSAPARKPAAPASAPAQRSSDEAAVAAIVASTAPADAVASDGGAAAQVAPDVAQVGMGPTAPVGESPAVPAVAHGTVPPVAPAIAMRTEAAEAQGSMAPQGGTGEAQPVVQPVVQPIVQPAVQLPKAPAAPSAPVSETPNAAVAKAPSAAAPVAPAPVYYPAPRVPVYQAPAQVPVMLQPPAPPIASAQVQTPVAPAPAPPVQMQPAVPPVSAPAPAPAPLPHSRPLRQLSKRVESQLLPRTFQLGRSASDRLPPDRYSAG